MSTPQPTTTAADAHNTTSAPSSPPSHTSVTILWSTQSGRAKACARRTARLLRSRGVSVQGRPTSSRSVTPHDNDGKARQRIGSSSSTSGRNGAEGGGGGGGYYGCTFDDYGVENFMNLGDLEEENNKKITSKLVVMFVSTTGDGEQCDPIRETWSALLQKSNPSTLFQSLQFALFCLGDRAYGPTAFCAGGRKLAARLVQLGAQPFCSVGYGDDGTLNGGVFADLDNWLEGTFLVTVGGTIREEEEDLAGGVVYDVKVEGGTSERKKDEKEEEGEWERVQYRRYYDEFFATLCPATAYRYDDQSGRRFEEESGGHVGRISSTPPLLGRVISNERITAEGWKQDTRHIRIGVETTRRRARDDTGVAAAPSSSSGAFIGNGDTAPPPLPYLAGDVATIVPSNSAQSINRFLTVLPQSLRCLSDVPLQITYDSSSGNTPWPKRCTLRGLLTHCAELTSYPEREDLRNLSRYCHPRHDRGPEQRTKLLSLSEPSGAALYGDYILREKRSWADVLYDFDSIRHEEEDDDDDDDDGKGGEKVALLTLEQLLLVLPPIRPRHFSIASAPSVSLLPREHVSATTTTNLASVCDAASAGSGGVLTSSYPVELDLCVAIVQGKTPHGRDYEGLCSGYLSRLHPPTTSYAPSQSQQPNVSCVVRLWIRPGSFAKLPLQPLPPSSSVSGEGKSTNYFETPVLCIGAGTGIAPLRSLLHEREAVRTLNLLRQSTTGKGQDHAPPPHGGDGQANTSSSSSSFFDNILIFGCRRETMDYYYQNEWMTLAKAKRLRALTAFSQDQVQKVYVQRILREATTTTTTCDDGNDNGTITKNLLVQHLLHANGAIYIAGGAKMARCVKEEMVELLSAELDGGEREAKVLLKRLQRVGRFGVEAWS